MRNVVSLLVLGFVLAVAGCATDEGTGGSGGSAGTGGSGGVAGSGGTVDLCMEVDCSDDNDCTDDVCDAADGSCSNPDDMDGSSCDFAGSAGVCMSGMCEDAMLCEGTDCSDGNECTMDLCNPDDGECSNPNETDGTTCDAGGDPGTCQAGVCTGLCDGVDCSDGNECTDDVCDAADGACSHPNRTNGVTCDFGGVGGVCMDGVCEDALLCEGVDCTDGDDCTEDVCDPADGSCSNPVKTDGAVCDASGDPGECQSGICTALCDITDCSDSNECTEDLCEPADGSCSNPDESDGTICDAAGDPGTCAVGICVGLCDGVDCGDDNECTRDLCDVADGACSNPNEMDGTACDFGGLAGVCNVGVCEEAMLCNGVDCSDGDDCTQDLCEPADGSCSNPDEMDGTVCDAAGDPGTCEVGVCVGLCDGVDCGDDNECTQDLCDVADGACSNPNETDGTACNGGAGTCQTGTCLTAIDPDPQSAILSMGCTNNVTADVSILPFTLEVDPSAVIGDAIVPVVFDGIAEFSEVFLDAAQGAVPGGVTAADLVNLAATTLIRTGGTGGSVVLTNAPIPATCLIGVTACNPANDGASVPGQQPNTDCVPTGTFNPCQQIVTLPTSSDCSSGGTCDLVGKGPGTSQCDVNGFCVTGGLPLPLDAQSSNFMADASGVVTFGWDDQNTGATPLNMDGTYALPGAVFTQPATPNEIKVNAGGLSVALRCTMAVDSGGPDGVGVPDQASPTPSDLLVTFDIQ
jgi:hypothetical protein